MLYELRHHDSHSGRSLESLTDQFDETILPVWEKVGIEAVGFWSVFVGPTSPRLTNLLAWESLEQRQRLWDAFLADPARQRLQEQYRREGALIHTVTNTILSPLPQSPLPRRDNQPPRLAGGVFEQRVLAFDAESKLRQCVEWFADKGMAHMNKHGMFLMGAWETSIGVAPRLTYMLVFENLAHRERAWASYHTDPDWPGLQAGLYPNGQPLIGQTESALLKGTQFSHWR